MNKIFIMGTLVFLVIIYVILMFQKNKICRELYCCLENKDYVLFQQKLELKAIQVLVPAYLKETMQLQMLKDLSQKKDIISQYNKLFKMKQSPVQRNHLMLDAYHYFCSIHNQKQSLKTLQYIQENLKEHAYLYQRHYDIVLKKETKYIEKLEKEMFKYNGLKKGYIEYLLAYSYQLIDNEKSQYYFQQSANDYHVEVDKLDNIARVI